LSLFRRRGWGQRYLGDEPGAGCEPGGDAQQEAEEKEEEAEEG